MTAIIHLHAPPDSRQPRQPDGRGRGVARGRQPRPRRRALGRIDRRARSGREARRRQEPLARQGRRRGGRGGEGRDRPGDHRHGGRGPERDRRRDDRAGRHRRTRRGSAPMPSSASASRSPRPPPTRAACRSTAMSAASRASVLPVPMMNIIERRRPCRQSDRLPGIHGDAGRRAELRRGAALRRRDLPHAEEGPARTPAWRPRSATRAASRPISPRRAMRSTSSCARSRRPATGPATTSCSRSTAPRPNIFRDGAYEMEGEGRTLSARPRMADYLADARRRLSDPLDRGRHGRGRSRGLEDADRQDRRQGPAGRRRPLRHQSRAAARWASPAASPTRS